MKLAIAALVVVFSGAIVMALDTSVQGRRKQVVDEIANLRKFIDQNTRAVTETENRLKVQRELLEFVVTNASKVKQYAEMYCNGTHPDPRAQSICERIPDIDDQISKGELEVERETKTLETLNEMVRTANSRMVCLVAMAVFNDNEIGYMLEDRNIKFDLDSVDVDTCHLVHCRPERSSIPNGAFSFVCRQSQ